ncbi:hypothetical protein O7605_16265 [Verrucosispora sp. WMMA2121]|uniref:hypothetical protein n=1 Tax=Verrucosispora sp. WMMA2121 TaxID=3015164 RepID=UPI0022B62216|nr:hypothetical protein [Verrucosispora sp. WMMA2121]MCZ7421067.1 hypothetical protein [Verrucosispora sp. WMMA2121]
MRRLPGRRAWRRTFASACALGLLVAGGAAVAPGAVAAGPAASRATEPVPYSPPAEPTEEPAPTSPPPTVEPPIETSGPAAPPTTPTPGTTTGGPVPSSGPPAVTAAPSRPTYSPPSRPADPTLAPPAAAGVKVTTGDVTLPAGYWNSASMVVTLNVTVANTGTASAGVRLSYTLPAGLTDAGTSGCADAGNREHRCGQWTTAPGAEFSTRLRIRVDGDAWRNVPLAGSVRVTATGAAGTASDDEGFAVLFPPGPPVPGITMSAGEVTFDAEGAGTELLVRLGNTGRADADGRVDVLLPAGVTVATPPAGCVAVAATRTRCELGTVRSGRTEEVRLPVTATAQALRSAPLSGAVIGRLDPRHGADRRMQLSFRITATSPELPAVVSPPAPVTSPALRPAGAAPGDGPAAGQRSTMLLITVSVLLVLAAGLVVAWLRRRASTLPTGGEASGAALRTEAANPAGGAPEPDSGIWFRARRPARTYDRQGWDVR